MFQVLLVDRNEPVAAGNWTAPVSKFSAIPGPAEEGAMETLAQCGLSAFFPAPFVLGREACAPKPSGDGICKLLHTWDARPEQAVMGGDFLYDLQAGREAGTFTVYFDVSGEGEYAAHADLCVHTFFELRDHLAG